MEIVDTHQPLELTPLEGGVSSDIYRVAAAGTTFCVKRALPKLRVAADWRAPVGRNRAEVAWMRVAGGIVPKAVPRILGEDPAAGAFAMEWLAPERYPVWKALLRDGTIRASDARAVGDTLGRLHAATADRPDLAREFGNDATFIPIRLEPYLSATGQAHPGLADRLEALVATTLGHKRVLVHGDFSPKNILIGPDGPVILDAECAVFGDPAFDLAFVVNHLWLKRVWKPQWTSRYRESLDALVDAYRARAAWEPWPALEARAAALLPGLLLGRVDGKSPAEYITADADREVIRAHAREFLQAPSASLAKMADRWFVARA